MKIALSAGHTPFRQGGETGMISEYGLTMVIIGDLVFRLQKAGHEAWIIGADSNLEQIKRINELDADCGLELHFNSHTGDKLNGTEVLHAGSEKGMLLAECVQKALVDRLGTKDLGIRLGHFQGNVTKPIIEMLKDTNCPFIVPEPLFLSNIFDLSRLDPAGIAIALFDGLITYFSRLKP
ncbi:N-acetylmuramoyl-L-alanine amidase [bacterium]|nr:N-acetylmuramoyl-L-alanine amidase [bacterium]